MKIIIELKKYYTTKYKLPHVRDRVLFNTPYLKVKNKQKHQMYNSAPVPHMTGNIAENNIFAQT